MYQEIFKHFVILARFCFNYAIRHYNSSDRVISFRTYSLLKKMKFAVCINFKEEFSPYIYFNNDSASISAFT